MRSIYWGFLRELSDIGVETEIFIHDCEFYPGTNREIAIRERVLFEKDLKLLISWMQAVSSSKTNIVLASKYYKKRRNIKKFLAKIYGEFLPYLANHSNLLINAHAPNLTLHNIRYLFGLCMMCHKEYKGIVLAMVWDGRTTLLENYIIDNMKDKDIYPIVGKTFCGQDGTTPLSTNDPNIFSLNNSDKTITKSLKALNKTNLRYIWHYVLGKDDTEFGDIEEMRLKIKDNIATIKKIVEGGKK